MTLSQEDLFKLALNLQDPWYIESIEFSAAKKQLDIHIDFIPGSRFECSNCKTQDNCIHDTKDKVWQHLNFFQFKAFIHARVPRTVCQKCGSIRLIDGNYSALLVVSRTCCNFVAALYPTIMTLRPSRNTFYLLPTPHLYLS